MSEMERATLQMLRDAAELYNDAEILRDAIEGDDHTPFSADYIEVERERLASTAWAMMASLDVLCRVAGIGFVTGARDAQVEN